MRVSVVIPAYNAAATIADCLRALTHQSLPSASYEIIVVNDGSTDGTAEIVRTFGVQLISQPNQGAPIARNVGIMAAQALWIAFTDADCIPSRNWLTALLVAVENHQGDPAIGAAGHTLGYRSIGAAARFVDLSGGLDAEQYLAHPNFPFAPTCNVLYRRDLLQQINGFDGRFRTYDACDLHTRMRGHFSGAMLVVPRAVVLHYHRQNWNSYFRQQRNYGYGYAQFTWHYRNKIQWSMWRELWEWGKVVQLGLLAMMTVFSSNDQGLLRQGVFIKYLAQRLGFMSAYYAPSERRRWV